MSIALMVSLGLGLFIASVICLSIAIIRILYYGSIVVDSTEQDLGEAFQLINNTYSQDEKDRFLNAIDNGDFKDANSTTELI